VELVPEGLAAGYGRAEHHAGQIIIPLTPIADLPTISAIEIVQ
jgi:hypothetical protein